MKAEKIVKKKVWNFVNMVRFLRSNHETCAILKISFLGVLKYNLLIDFGKTQCLKIHQKIRQNIRQNFLQEIRQKTSK